MHKRLDHYLNQLRSQLKALPTEKREAELREIRIHLETLVRDYQSEGLSEKDAVDKALDQFGSPKTNGRALRQVWGRTALYKRDVFKRTSIVLSVILTSFLFVFATMFTLSSAVYPMSSHFGTIAMIDRQHELEVQGIQKRWRDDNFDIQHMNPRNAVAVSRAQVAAMNRVNSAMTASGNRWQSRVQAYQQETLVVNTLYALVGGVVMSALLAALLLVTFRVLGSRKPNRMSVS